MKPSRSRLVVLLVRLVAPLATVLPVAHASSSTTPAAGSHRARAHAPNGFRYRALGGKGGWKVTWKKVPGATGYTVANSLTHRTFQVTRPSAVVADAADRRETLRVGLTVTARFGAGPSRATARTSTPCSPVYLYAARGSGQALGPGSQGQALADKARRHLGGLSKTQLPLLYDYYEAFDYPHHPERYKKYLKSVDQGSEIAQRFLYDLHRVCPGSKVVLFGFSQGAQVIGNTIQASFNDYAVPQMLEVMLLADPRREDDDTVVHPQHTGHDGIFGGRPLLAADRAHVTESWCDPKDSVCSKGRAFDHYGVGPDDYLVDCITWSVEYNLRNRPFAHWSRRAQPDACRQT